MYVTLRSHNESKMLVDKKCLRQQKRENFGLEIWVRKIRLFITCFLTFVRLDAFYIKVKHLNKTQIFLTTVPTFLITERFRILPEIAGSFVENTLYIYYPLTQMVTVFLIIMGWSRCCSARARVWGEDARVFHRPDRHKSSRWLN